MFFRKRFSHKKIERSVTLLFVLAFLVVTIGGIVEIVPLFWVHNTIEKVSGMRPYTPLELAGRNIYIRDGCHNCHSQMIRTLRDEVDRYGHYSLAAESMYDHPFQWGSKRTGPDLARVGGRYSDDWHVLHMISPKSVVPESIMPSYDYLLGSSLDYSDIGSHLWVNSILGVPYDAGMISSAESDMRAQSHPDADGQEGLLERYGDGVKVRDFAGDGVEISEMDALVAYLQMLGTLVDFSDYEEQR